jgi:hypothetical protein
MRQRATPDPLVCAAAGSSVPAALFPGWPTCFQVVGRSAVSLVPPQASTSVPAALSRSNAAGTTVAVASATAAAIPKLSSHGSDARRPLSADARRGENSEAAAFSAVKPELNGPATRALRDLTHATSTSWSSISAAMGLPRATVTNIKELEQRVAAEREMPSGIRSNRASLTHTTSDDGDVSDEDDDGSDRPTVARDSNAIGAPGSQSDFCARFWPQRALKLSSPNARAALLGGRARCAHFGHGAGSARRYGAGAECGPSDRPTVLSTRIPKHGHSWCGAAPSTCKHFGSFGLISNDCAASRTYFRGCKCVICVGNLHG